MKVDWPQWIDCKGHFLRIMDLEVDGIRFHYLGNNEHRCVEHHVAKESFDVDGPLITQSGRNRAASFSDGSAERAHFYRRARDHRN